MGNNRIHIKATDGGGLRFKPIKDGGVKKGSFFGKKVTLTDKEGKKLKFNHSSVVNDINRQLESIPKDKTKNIKPLSKSFLGFGGSSKKRIHDGYSFIYSAKTGKANEPKEHVKNKKEKVIKNPVLHQDNINPIINNENKYNINKHAKTILPAYQNALQKSHDAEVKTLLNEYQQTAAMYATWNMNEVAEVFSKANFLVVHGAMHVSHTALLVPLMVNFYKACGDERAINLTEEDVVVMQIIAFYHDYGRTKYKNDLVNDAKFMETQGSLECVKYLKSQGFSDALASRAGKAILEKDKTPKEGLLTKDIFCEIIQNCDCLGYIRAHDSAFNKDYLDVVKRLPHFTKMENREEMLYQILDSTKLFLMSIGDSPSKDYQPLSKKFKADKDKNFQGRISFEDKRKYETSVDCFDLMQTKMREFEDLQYWLESPPLKKA